MTYLERGERAADAATFAELDLAARRIAHSLVSAGLKRRAALIAVPPTLDFIRAFLGCLYAEVYAVPVPFATRGHGLDRIAGIAADAQPAAVLVETGSAADALRGNVPDKVHIIIVGDALQSPPLAFGSEPAPESIAFVQYTSGSTSRPKGVVVTHRNIMANQAMIQDAFGHGPDTVVVNWLPLHHDMGLIGSILQPIYLGAHAITMSPLAFLQKPVRWLQAIDTYRGTTSGAPNFAFDTCVRHVRETQREGLDLSSWTLAFCGSEPVRLSTMQAFAQRFASAGFAAKALYPCYGLAEATLFVTGPKAGSGIRTHSFVPSAAAMLAFDVQNRDAVCCGTTWRNAAVIVLDAGQRPAEPGAVGEICVAGDAISPGFWSAETGTFRPDALRQVVVDGRTFLRTGDLGRLVAGELYVVGRIKDMIVVRGANIYAEDVEETVLAASVGTKIVAAAAFGIDQAGQERLVVVCEAGRAGRRVDDLADTLPALKARIGDVHGIVPHDLVVVPSGGIARSSSGKIQRGMTRLRYLDRTLQSRASC